MYIDIIPYLLFACWVVFVVLENSLKKIEPRHTQFTYIISNCLVPDQARRFDGPNVWFKLFEKVIVR